jgi:hypothetical protein
MPVSRRGVGGSGGLGHACMDPEPRRWRNMSQGGGSDNSDGGGSQSCDALAIARPATNRGGQQ